MQKAVAHEKQGEGMTCSSDTSRWSSPSGLYSSSDDPQYTSVCEDKADAIPSFQWQGSKRSRRLVFGIFHISDISISKYFIYNSLYHE